MNTLTFENWLKYLKSGWLGMQSGNVELIYFWCEHRNDLRYVSLLEAKDRLVKGVPFLNEGTMGSPDRRNSFFLVPTKKINSNLIENELLSAANNEIKQAFTIEATEDNL